VKSDLAQWHAALDLANATLEIIGREMARQGMTREMLATFSGVPLRTLLAILDGEVSMHMREMADIGQALGIRFNLELVPLELGPRDVCLAHLEEEPCGMCRSYIAAGL